MSHKLNLLPEEIDTILEKLRDKLDRAPLYSGKIKLEYESASLPDRTSLEFKPVAWLKMQGLIGEFTSEVAWHGTAERTDNGYIINDIIVYPQKVSGSTVNTDQKEYETWLLSLPDEEFNNLRMQGHSHVNMSVSPSSVDLTHQDAIIEQLGANDFYIFLICNKSGSCYIKILDRERNRQYDTQDVDLYVGGVLFDSKAFIDNAKKLVTQKVYYSGYSATNPVTPVTYPSGQFYEDDWDDFYEQSKLSNNDKPDSKKGGSKNAKQDSRSSKRRFHRK